MNNPSAISGILLVDKPIGITSYDVIRRIKTKFPNRKIGHAGTLDPLASGLLIVGVGSATKQLTRLFKKEKTYKADILLGRATTTGDMEGEITAEESVLSKVSKNESSKQIEKIQKEAQRVLESFVSEESVPLPVPAYSAVKRDGEPLYKKARRGETVALPMREMKIISGRLESVRAEGSCIVFVITLMVGSGVYVRSVAEEVGRRLGYPATLCGLRRTVVGEYLVEDADSIEQILESNPNLI